MKVSANNPTLNRHLFCGICSNLFLSPMRLSCGHTYCEKCVQTSITDRCTSCKKRLIRGQTQRDILAGRLIDELQVECANQGCPWKGTFLDYKFHADKCELKAGVEGFLERMEKLRQSTERDLGMLDKSKQKEQDQEEVKEDPTVETVPFEIVKGEKEAVAEDNLPAPLEKQQPATVPSSQPTNPEIDHTWGFEAQRKLKTPSKPEDSNDNV